MKKITLFILLFITSWQMNAQFGCGSAVIVTNGYNASAITTPGNAGPEDWNTNPTGTSISASYWDDDVYLFQYTAGATQEVISMTTFSRNSWNGIGIFTTCTGTTFSGELAAQGTSGTNATKTVSSIINAGQTVYIATGQWGTPNGLDFDVTSFTATPVTTVPNCTVFTAPLNGATNTNTEGIFTWTTVTNASGYLLNVGTTPGGTDVLNMFDAGNVATYNVPGVLLPSTIYYAKVIPYNAIGEAVGCAEMSFTTGMASVNDNCTSAVVLTVNQDLNCGSTVSGTLLNATDSGITDNGAGTPNDDVWYSFVATATSQKIVLSNVTGTPTDLVHETMAGTCGGTLTSVLVSDADTSYPSGLIIGNTYYVRVFSYAALTGATTAFTICVGTPPPAPLNDNCTGVVALTVNPNFTCTSTTNGTLLSATDSGVTDNGAGTPNDDVWYSFIATATTHRIILSNVTGTPTDLVHETMAGTCGGTLASVLVSDADTSNPIGLIIGNTYYVRIFSYSSSTGATTAFTICVGTPPPPPVNNEPSDALPLTVNTDLACAVTTTGTTISATASTEAAPSCSATGINDDVWYTFTATSVAHRFVYSAVTTGTIATALYTGTPGSLVQLAGACLSGNTQNFTGLTVGTSYYARVYTTTATVTTTTNFTVCLGVPPPAPVNDLIVNASVLTESTNETCNNGLVGTTDSATHTVDYICSATDVDVWYTFTPSTTGTYNFNRTITAGTGTGYISVYSGVSGSLTRLNTSCTVNNFAQALTAGTTYYISVASTSTLTVSFSLCAYLIPAAPANDLCANATPLNAGGVFATGAIVGSTAGATTVTGLTYTCQVNRSEDVWYSVTVPASGNLTVETKQVTGSPLLDTVLSVFSGTCGSLTEIGCSDDEGEGNHSLKSLVGQTPGATLYIGVWKFNTSATGQFQVSAYDASLSTTGFDNNGFSAYPNPVKDVLNLSYTQNISNVAVYNLLGQQVIAKTINANQSQIDMSHLSSGAYMVKVTADNQVKMIKVIKE